MACRCKLYKDLCEIADTEVLGVMPRKSGIKIEDILCFFYYSGIAYAAMKRWKRAMDAFSMCLVTPAAALSAVAIEAQKRRILCSLIATGALPASPKAATTGMMQGLKKPTAAYTAIAHAFAAREPACEFARILCIVMVPVVLCGAMISFLLPASWCCCFGVQCWRNRLPSIWRCSRPME